MIRYFRITDKGSVKKPTPQAMFTIFFHAVICGLIFHDSPGWGVGTIMVGYVFWAMVLSKPFRVSMCKMFYSSRASRIYAKPVRDDALWRKANAPILYQAKIKIFDGTDIDKPLEEKM